MPERIRPFALLNKNAMRIALIGSVGSAVKLEIPKGD
jgi:hypothetical protein